jgi:Nucleolar protein,Nop52
MQCTLHALQWRLTCVLAAQEALAQRLAEILPQLPDEVMTVIGWRIMQKECRIARFAVPSAAFRIAQVAFGYFRIFLVTMRREWFGIDRLRLDKFMMLVRKFMQQTFVHLRNADWCGRRHDLVAAVLCVDIGFATVIIVAAYSCPTCVSMSCVPVVYLSGTTSAWRLSWTRSRGRCC